MHWFLVPSSPDGLKLVQLVLQNNTFLQGVIHLLTQLCQGSGEQCNALLVFVNFCADLLGVPAQQVPGLLPGGGGAAWRFKGVLGAEEWGGARGDRRQGGQSAATSVCLQV